MALVVDVVAELKRIIIPVWWVSLEGTRTLVTGRARNKEKASGRLFICQDMPGFEIVPNLLGTMEPPGFDYLIRFRAYIILVVPISTPAKPTLVDTNHRVSDLPPSNHPTR